MNESESYHPATIDTLLKGLVYYVRSLHRLEFSDAPEDSRFNALRGSIKIEVPSLNNSKGLDEETAARVRLEIEAIYTILNTHQLELPGRDSPRPSEDL